MNGPRVPWRRLLLAALAALFTLGVGMTGMRAGADPGAGGSSVTVSKTVTRVHLVDGADLPADSRNVTLTVSQTTDLRSQRIAVSWTGAHPTGGIFADQNAPQASNEEYPFVLMECRGVSDDPSLPATSRLSPQTCWTQNFPVERYVETRDVNNAFPPYRVDRYATPADRRAVVNPALQCNDSALVQHWVPFTAANGTTYYGGRDDCAGSPPDASDATTQNRPGNTTYGVTKSDGTGSALFSVWTAQDNASLGCSTTVACSLVAVPIEGISCDVAAAGLPTDDQPGDQADPASTGCRATGKYKAGDVSSTGDDSRADQAVTGRLWWSASNWRNRITVPLSFSPSADACSVVTTLPQVPVYGSELLTQATAQWAPALCTQAGGLNLRHIQSGEPQARNLLLGSGIKAAFVSAGPPGGYPVPTVSAPTAVTGFAVSYVIDDANGEPYTSLRLTPRLLAKLMTESYPTLNQVRSGASYLSGNPLTVIDDPEFLALNPGLKGIEDRDPADGALVLVSSDSDVVTALTSYIEADPVAAAWLDGDPDPWGMTVNRNYQTHRARAEVSLPTSSWPLLDSYEPTDYYNLGGADLVNPCLHADPVPYLPLVAAPVGRLATITQDVELALPTSQTKCYQPTDGSTIGQKLVSPGRQAQGGRFLIGITPLADASRYLLTTAALQTHLAAGIPGKFGDATGQTFVAPSPASLQAAAVRATPDDSTGVWELPYSTLRSDPTAAGAYPGTMIVSTAVPTRGLSTADASDYAQLLRFIAGPGQVPGLSNGQLAPGYLPITAGNGLGALQAHTVAAASAVAAQTGQVPALVPATPPPTTGPAAKPGPTSSPRPSVPTSASPSATAAGPILPPAGASTAPGGFVRSSSPRLSGPAAPESPVVATPAPQQLQQVAEVARTKGQNAGGVAGLVPILVLLAAACLPAAGLTFAAGSRRQRR